MKQLFALLLILGMVSCRDTETKKESQSETIEVEVEVTTETVSETTTVTETTEVEVVDESAVLSEESSEETPVRY